MSGHAQGERRVTTTNEGVERRGALRFLGFELEGDSYRYLVAGALVSLLAWVVLQRAGMPLPLHAAAAGLPLAGALLWLRCMVCGRPPAHQSDVLDTWFRGGDFWTDPATFDPASHPVESNCRTCRTVERRAGT